MFIELAWQSSDGRELAIEGRAQGLVAVNDVNSDFAAGYGVVGLRGETTLSGLSGRFDSVSLFGRINNLFDRRHASSVIVNEGNGRFFEPGAPLSFMVGIRLKL